MLLKRVTNSSMPSSPKQKKVVFAPWRMDFILGKKEKGCVFCTRQKRRKDREDLILHRGKHYFVILNKYPYNNGHLMIVPNRHIQSSEQLRPQEMVELVGLMNQSMRALKITRPHGFNMGANLGRAAGAGIEEHFHFHVIPRWFGDTNFWPVIAETKSMPEHLLTTYDKLKKAWS